MKKTWLSPMSPDGKPGEVMEMEVSDEAPQYLEPLAENDALGNLRHKVHAAAAALRNAKTRGAKAAEIAALKTAFESAKTEMESAHREQQKARTQQKTGIDYGAPSPFSRDTRQFAEVVDYSVNDYDGNDTTGRSYDDKADDALEAQILAAVAAVEQAQSNGASWAEILRLEAALKDLRDKLPNPQKPFGEAPHRKSHISRPAPPVTTGQTAATAKTGWDKFLADLDDRLAKRALEALRRGGASAATHRAKNALALNWNTFLRDPSLRPA